MTYIEETNSFEMGKNDYIDFKSLSIRDKISFVYDYVFNNINEPGFLYDEGDSYEDSDVSFEPDFDSSASDRINKAVESFYNLADITNYTNIGISLANIILSCKIFQPEVNSLILSIPNLKMYYLYNFIDKDDLEALNQFKSLLLMHGLIFKTLTQTEKIAFIKEMPKHINTNLTNIDKISHYSDIVRLINIEKSLIPN